LEEGRLFKALQVVCVHVRLSADSDLYELSY